MNSASQSEDNPASARLAQSAHTEITLADSGGKSSIVHMRGVVGPTLNEHGQLSAIVEGMLRFTHLLETGSKAPGLMVFRAMPR